MGRWASVRGSGALVNILLEPTPHHLGMYALLRDGRRGVNLVWSSEVDPMGGWLEWAGPRFRDHFSVCPGSPTVRTSRELVRIAVEGIGEPISEKCDRIRRIRSRRLRDWP